VRCATLLANDGVNPCPRQRGHGCTSDLWREKSLWRLCGKRWQLL